MGTPITDLYGQPVHGVRLGLRTELAIARAADTGDIDPVSVRPLPVQEHILAAFAQLGFRFIGTGLEYGHLHGRHQTLPFYQAINFHPPPQYGQGTNEVPLSFVAGPSSVEVILECGNRAGMARLPLHLDRLISNTPRLSVLKSTARSRCGPLPHHRPTTHRFSNAGKCSTSPALSPRSPRSCSSSCSPSAPTPQDT